MRVSIGSDHADLAFKMVDVWLKTTSWVVATVAGVDKIRQLVADNFR